MGMTTDLRHPKVTTPHTPSRKAQQKAKDRAESAQVRQRSGGRCEVRELVRAGLSTGIFPCIHTAVHVHHMIGGRGKRGIDISALAIHKQHVCTDCHRSIGGVVGGKRLILIPSGPLPVYTDYYRRVR